MLPLAIRYNVQYAMVCKCGCGEHFVARSKSPPGGGDLFIPEYRRGHHPNCRRTQTGNIPVWNGGKKKGDHPSLSRMGFQAGSAHWNWQEDKNPDWFAPDF